MAFNIDNIKFSLSSLSVYKTDSDILSDLSNFLFTLSNIDDFDLTVIAYCDFCNKLYNKANGNLPDYINQIIMYSDNSFSRAYAESKNPPDYIENAAINDLNSLKYISELCSSDIKEYLKGIYKDKASQIDLLPDFMPTTTISVMTADATKEFYKNNCFGEFARCKAFSYDKKGGNYYLTSIDNPDPIKLSDLKHYEVQREKIVNNTLAFIKGKPYNNALLYGDRGTGKSSTIKAILNEYANEGLRLIQIDKQNLYGLPELIEKLVNIPLKFILFVDDLTFTENDDSFGMLKAALEGGIVKRPDNIAIYATSNRRHLIKETFTAREGSEVHAADTIDENLSLSDRFGLAITFSAPAKDKYLEIVKLIAEDRKLDIDDETLFRGAEQFSVRKGGRSPRLARQYIDDLEARIALKLI